jgi:sugar phosphate permease
LSSRQPVADPERATLRRVAWRLLPFLTLGYLISFIDRANVGFAALQMNHDLGLSAAAFGFGSGLFFLSYALLEVPSNLILQRVGARRWIARIMISWGLASAAMAWVSGPNSFYTLRLLLGAAEAGFFPGVIVYISHWFPAPFRARIIAMFMIAIPMSSVLASPLSATLLRLEGLLGWHGWQWLFVIEGLPALLLGLLAYWWLPDRPSQARWLSPDQCRWLTDRLESEAAARDSAVPPVSLWRLFCNRYVLVAALLCAASTAVSQSISIWQPQIIKSLGLDATQTGWVNGVPFLLASIGMVWWGRRSDARNERVWHCGLPLLLVGAGLALTPFAATLAPMLILLTLILTGVYAFKGPFWALSTEWLSAPTAAGGIAYINAIGAAATFASTSLLGLIRDRTGSFTLALLPMAALSVVAVWALIWISRVPRPVSASVRSER